MERSIDVKRSMLGLLAAGFLTLSTAGAVPASALSVGVITTDDHHGHRHHHGDHEGHHHRHHHGDHGDDGHNRNGHKGDCTGGLINICL
jgi:hypothetical protein